MTAAVIESTVLSDEEFTAALAEVAGYEQRIAQAGRLEQEDSLRVAAILDRLYRDEHWVAERNAERAASAKTARGGRPVDPTSRSQFSTWLRGRYKRFEPRRVYQLLDAEMLVMSYLNGVQITPTSEWQLRPLKSLLSRANGSGKRIRPVWKLACEIAEDAGREAPTADDVRRGIAEWRRLNLTPQEHRHEVAEDRAWVKERKAVAAWKELIRIGDMDQINEFLDVIKADVAELERTWSA